MTNLLRKIRKTEMIAKLFCLALSFAALGCGESSTSGTQNYSSTSALSGRWILTSIGAVPVAEQDSASLLIADASLSQALTAQETFGYVVAFERGDGSLELGESHPAYSLHTSAVNFELIRTTIQAAQSLPALLPSGELQIGLLLFQSAD